MTKHALAKIQKAEQAAEAAGLMGGWLDITEWMNIINEVYGAPPEERPVKVRSIDQVEKVLLACYSS